MRNLKKILALVLALIMSLSLMATAGATDFKDDENVGDVYRQAVEVLSDLGVFNGDQNGNFNPEKPITRAEVAAIIYRIATGDVNNERNDSYAPYNQFPDIMEGDWYAGYVTYCANAGYVKGRNTGNFDPKDQVTGYEVLAMILRAVGYDKNNEFVGSNWQTNTASLATQKGVLKNITSATSLGAPATRETVAELLFRSILLNQVNWSAATLSYDDNRETLAKQNLNMERIEGVVVANHLADLGDDYIDLDQGETRLSTGNVLDVETGLDDIGESRYAYIQNGTRVLGSLEDTGKNGNTYDNEGAPVTNLVAASGLSLSGSDHYINYSKSGRLYCDWRIEYSVTFDNSKKVGTQTAEEWFDEKYCDVSDVIDDDNRLDSVETAGDKITYTRVIPATETIFWSDLAIIRGIFAVADDSNSDISLGIDGYVFAGTNSNSNVDRNIDLSDTMPYNDFYADYIKGEYDTTVPGADRGEWLKVIDNDDDGIAEYVLLLTYELDKVVGYNTRTEAYILQAAHAEDEGRTKNIDVTDAACDYVPVPMDGYEFAVDDVVITARIDGQLLTWAADTKVATIKTYNYRPIGSETVVTTEDESYYQSGIENDTLYADQIEAMNYGTEYHLYFDRYNNIRAWTPVDGSKHYGLLTDMYFTNYNNSNYIRNQIATAELTYGKDGVKVPTNEYTVSNHSQTAWNPFVGIEQPAGRDGAGTDWLQRAIAHLDMGYDNGTADGAYWYTPSDGLRDAAGNYTGGPIGSEFDYDGDATSKNKPSFALTSSSVTAANGITTSRTNVAKYTLSEDGKSVALETVSEYAYNLKGEQYFYVYNSDAGRPVVMLFSDAYAATGATQSSAANWYAALNRPMSDKTNIVIRPVYAVDYVMLDSTKAISAKQTQYPIDGQYDGWMNSHVNAVNDTEFYLVTPSNIYYQVGRNEIPAIAADKIASMYAVASITNVDSYDRQYWVADVIVIELNEELDNVYSHVFLNLWDNYRNARAVIHELNGFDGQTGEFTQVIIENAWAGAMQPGFYVLSDDASVDENGVITASDAKLVTSLGDYNAFGIYAGKIDRVEQDYVRGSYIEVIKGPSGTAATDYRTRVELSGSTPWYGVYQKSATNNSINDWDLLIEAEYNNVGVNGDDIIWVTYGGKTIFVVETDFTPNAQTYASTIMQNIAGDIQTEQRGADKYTVTARVIDSSDTAIANTSVKLFDATTKKAVTDVKVVNAEKGLTLTYEPTGFDKANVTGIRSANANATVAFDEKGQVVVSDIKGDVTIEIIATRVNKNLTIAAGDTTGWVSTAGDATDQYVVPHKNDVTVNGALMDTADAAVTNVPVEVGSTVVVYVDADTDKTPALNFSDGTSYTGVKINRSAPNTQGAWYAITFTMPNKDVNATVGVASNINVVSADPSKVTAKFMGGVVTTLNQVNIQLSPVNSSLDAATQQWSVKSVTLITSTGSTKYTGDDVQASVTAGLVSFGTHNSLTGVTTIEIEAEIVAKTRDITVEIPATVLTETDVSKLAFIASVTATVDGKAIEAYSVTPAGYVAASAPNPAVDAHNTVVYRVAMDKSVTLTFTATNGQALTYEVDDTATAFANNTYTVTKKSDTTVEVANAGGASNDTAYDYTFNGLTTGDTVAVTTVGGGTVSKTVATGESSVIIPLSSGDQITSISITRDIGFSTAKWGMLDWATAGDANDKIVDIAANAKAVTFSYNQIAVSAAIAIEFKTPAAKTYTFTGDFAENDDVTIAISNYTDKIVTMSTTVANNKIELPVGASITSITVTVAAPGSNTKATLTAKATGDTSLTIAQASLAGSGNDTLTKTYGTAVPVANDTELELALA